MSVSNLYDSQSFVGQIRSYHELISHVDSFDSSALGEQRLRKPVIHGLLRRGETMSLIAPYDTGKSWMAIDLALAVATGDKWLGDMPCEAGRVLFIDSELHAETFAQRMRTVAEAKQIGLDRISDRIDVSMLRCSALGDLRIGDYLDSIKAKSYDVVIIDSFEPFMLTKSKHIESLAPDQSSILYHLANEMGSALVLVQHSTLSNEPNRLTGGVAKAKGSQSLDTDTVVTLRAHHVDNAVVMQTASRSWPAQQPRCLRWQFPVWQPDASLCTAKPGSGDERKFRARAIRGY
jgi:RecA-family ATPase